MTEDTRQRKKNITFPVSVHSQPSDAHADTRSLCRSKRGGVGGGARVAGARLLATDRAQRGASVRRRCEDKIRVITALQQPRLIRDKRYSPASQYDIFFSTSVRVTPWRSTCVSVVHCDLVLLSLYISQEAWRRTGLEVWRLSTDISFDDSFKTILAFDGKWFSWFA